MKKFLVICLMFLTVFSATEAAILEKDSEIAVMDFGILKRELEENLSLKDVGLMTSDYIIERFADRKYFNVIERPHLTEKLQHENLITVGSISPDDAKKIGEILKVRYLIYGNVADVSLAEDNEVVVTVNTIKARIIAKVLDVQTGKILMAAKGEGKSDSALVSLDGEATVTIGTKRVSQVSVHNALKKAAFQATDILIERLSGNPDKFL